MTVECLKAAGLTEFQVSVGQVDYYKSLLAEADLEPEMEEHLRELISQKNYFGVEELLKGQNLSESLSGKSKKTYLQSGGTFRSKTSGRDLRDPESIWL